ncbi:uncharacterized protein LAESUDRAFT_719732 [Laetiporus sulphureus 93-53]|uniref:USP domain-containing protein n=1 Tax=Laetiporus sulphureus 93-53 TaxID=1314785 RepID=A0A165HIZ0_9APHY|nr:uncharacterized protein LAESUDRAFT_719732 [Laetiporus sulphureus 93-53]KZT11788.1 hypothetical protein LAESUDRAFT_719732 [Laetiporus sulphureus 93-53]
MHAHYRCHRDTTRTLIIHQPPPLFALEIQPNSLPGQPLIDIETVCMIPTDSGPARYRLAGVVYAGDFHFTCRVVTGADKVWRHDGRATGRSCELEFPNPLLLISYMNVGELLP